MSKTDKNSKPVVLTDSDFDDFVKKHPLVVVDFWAPWCPPCKMVEPAVNELASEYAGKVIFGKVNVDENRQVPLRYGIMAIPTFLFFKNGEPVDTMVGVLPKLQFKQMIERKLLET